MDVSVCDSTYISFGEKWNVLFKRGEAKLPEQNIIHRIQIPVLSYEWNKFIICFI